MNIESHDPIRNPKSPIRHPIQRIITYLLIVVLMVLLAMVVIQPRRLYRMRDQGPPPIAPPHPDSGRTLPGGLDLDRLLTDPTSVNHILPAGTKPLDHDPANLPTPPDSEILLRYQTGSPTTGGEESCVRVMHDTTIESAASFYRQALRDAHWAFVEKIPAPLVLRLVAQPQAPATSGSPAQSLLIRLHQVGSEVRLVLQLRYTSRTSS